MKMDKLMMASEWLASEEGKAYMSAMPMDILLQSNPVASGCYIAEGYHKYRKAVEVCWECKFYNRDWYNCNHHKEIKIGLASCTNWQERISE